MDLSWVEKSEMKDTQHKVSFRCAPRPSNAVCCVRICEASVGLQPVLMPRVMDGLLCSFAGTLTSLHLHIVLFTIMFAPFVDSLLIAMNRCISQLLTYPKP